MFILVCAAHFLKMIIWKQTAYKYHLVEAFGTAAKLDLTQTAFFVISTSNLEHNLFWFIDFQAVLE